MPTSKTKCFSMVAMFCEYLLTILSMMPHAGSHFVSPVLFLAPWTTQALSLLSACDIYEALRVGKGRPRCHHRPNFAQVLIEP